MPWWASRCPRFHKEGVTISPNDTTQPVRVAQKGKRVTVRRRSGQELTGAFFDAVVPLEAIEAVLIRTK